MLKNELKTNSYLENDHDYMVKVVVVGDSGVGKTNIISRYLKNEFNENSKSTIGCEFANKTIRVANIKIKFQIWDTAGQERYRAITNSFYNYSKGVLLVFDLSEHSSFVNLEGWLSDIEKNIGKEVSILVLGNKSDKERKVDKVELDNYIKDNNLEYIETSALKNENIDIAFDKLAKSNKGLNVYYINNTITLALLLLIIIYYYLLSFRD